MSKKILLVEDEKTTILLLNKFIKDLGYHIASTVPSGEEAFREVVKLNPDVVLMDIVLDGEIDGIQAARQIIDTHNIPVIYITSSSDSGTLKRALITNPSGYIVKPVDKNELKSAIDLAILRNEMEEKLKQSELRFFTILNSIGDAVMVMDMQDRITYVNPIAEKITELTIDKLLGKRFADVMNIRYNGTHDSPNSLEDTIHFNYFIPLSGKKVPIDFSISSISDIDGKKSGSVIILRDDTERVVSELKLKESYLRIKKSVDGIIQAMSQTLETRDPYTAGHQRRVADIARHIAIEMSLDENQVEGIFMAGMVHDVGKICIPTEILSKPGRLSPIEFDLIKTHPQIGYDILKTIEFPWPLAEMVYQHHERYNGSGYPRGLSGDEILLGARIICVADVVEAMASNRPYRDALGIDKALSEITDKKGKHFDKDVVEICIRIFIEKKYRMP
jgi:PAS domain S-box-containing protein